MKLVGYAVVLTLGLALVPTVRAEITFETLLNEMVDRDSLARWPLPEYSCRQASSYDRQTISADRPGWFANQDHTQYLRSEVNDGRTEHVMLDVDGPGALVRFWLTTAEQKQGMLRIYLDANSQPALTFPAFDLLSGELAIGIPLAQPHPGYGPQRGGNTLYLPVPYARHCKVTWEEKSSGPRYYQINYRTYSPKTIVKTWDRRQFAAGRRTIDEVNGQLLTADDVGAGNEISVSETLGAKAEQRIDLPVGSAALRGLSLKLQSDSDEQLEQSLRSVIVQLQFDGETTVWCPATDFFGSGVGLNPLRSWSRSVDDDGTMRCRWVMPYEKKSSIVLINLGSRPLKATLRATTGPWKWDDRSMHFHSIWHHESGLKTQPERDWNVVRISGRGVHAGDSLALFNPVSTWYGEGDEKILVDGESFPSHMGTGTEDYYGYSFAPQGLIQTPFVNQVRIDEPMTQGHNVLSRTRLLDGIPFHKSFDFSLELISWRPTNLTYAATTYWYAFPGATTNCEPQPTEAALPIPTLAEARAAELAARPRMAGAIECETMKVLKHSDGLKINKQHMEPWGADRWSGGEHLIAMGTGPGSFFELEVPAATSSPRKVVIYATQAVDYGMSKFRVNDQPTDVTFDGYAEQVQPAGPVNLGVFEPKEHRFVIRAEIAGANPKAVGPRFLFALDCVVLEDPSQRTIHSQPSLTLNTPQVELAVTLLGGHMSPVTFYRDSARPVQPYYISPWQDEPASPMPAPVLVPLRGDFFCMPFGGNQETVSGEKHPPHGETAGSRWESLGVSRNGKVTTLALSLETKVRKGKVLKRLSLVDGHNVVYSQHAIEGFAGHVPLGHHATLAMSDQDESVRLTPGPFRFGMTYPGLFADPIQREYQSLLPGTRWTELKRVPVGWKNQPDADLTSLPARRGFADLVQIFSEPTSKAGTPAWMTVTFPKDHYVWFSLKDPDVLQSTVFWIENHGRHGHPWNGRNNCLGLEDVTAYFADGLAASIAENALTKEGIKTAIELRTDRPTKVNYIQGVVNVPAEFDVVKTIEFAPGNATFVSNSNQRVTVPVHHDFVKSGELP